MSSPVLQITPEINRVLKPGGTAFIGVKLSFWGFLHQKQGRYYVQTTYLGNSCALSYPITSSQSIL